MCGHGNCCNKSNRCCEKPKNRCCEKPKNKCCKKPKNTCCEYKPKCGCGHDNCQCNVYLNPLFINYPFRKKSYEIYW